MNRTTQNTNAELQDITTSVFSFEKLRENDYLYVDKTALIHELFLQDEGQYFLARPRRFGKSLLISTLKAIFEGKRELFRGLAIDSLGYHWTKYPVIHLNMDARMGDTPEELTATINHMLAEIIRKNHLDVSETGSSGDRLEDIIRQMAKQSPTGRVVVLVDEYDKPLLEHLWKSDVTQIKDLLKAFYSVLKVTEGIQHFALLSGMSRFSMASEFSDLNNLTNLTMDASAATLLGYTHAELRENFGGHVAALAAAKGLTPEAAYAKLEEWYGGYRFHHGAETVFNPVSIGMCLTECKLKNYWYESGTPTFLPEPLRRQPIELAEITASKSDFSVYEPEKPRLLPLLVQSGYLTIKGFEKEDDMDLTFILGFPNYEVSETFDESLVTEFCQVEVDRESYLDRIQVSLQDGDIDGLFETLREFFRGISYDLIVQKERFYQMVFYSIVRLSGGDFQPEVHTSIGRIDAVLKTEKRIFVIEFKLDGTAEEALAQIREKQYCEKYRDDGREIVRVGVEFDHKTHNLGKWLAERVTD